MKEVRLSKEKRIKFRKHVIAVAKDVKRYHAKPGDDLRDVKPGKMPYSRKGAERFFMHVRRGNLLEVMNALVDDRFLVYQHNEMM